MVGTETGTAGLIPQRVIDPVGVGPSVRAWPENATVHYLGAPYLTPLSRFWGPNFNPWSNLGMFKRLYIDSGERFC